jgi:hypothetical protein
MRTAWSSRSNALGRGGLPRSWSTDDRRSRASRWRVVASRAARVRRAHRRRGTEGSNPPSSSGESANPRSLSTSADFAAASSRGRLPPEAAKEPLDRPRTVPAGATAAPLTSPAHHTLTGAIDRRVARLQGFGAWRGLSDFLEVLCNPQELALRLWAQPRPGQVPASGMRQLAPATRG